MAIAKRMTEPQAKALVASMKSGVPAQAHVPAPKVPKAAKPRTDSSHLEAKAPAESVPSNHGPQLEVSAQTASQVPPPQAPASMGTMESAGWDILAGLPVATQIRAKIKKGERPSLAEAFILLADLLWRFLLWSSKLGWKLAKWLTKEFARMTKDAFKSLLDFFGPLVRKTVSFVLGLALLSGMIWLVWDFHQTHLTRTWHVVSGWVYHRSHSETVSVVTPVATQSADSLHQGTLASAPESAQSNPGSQLVASTQMPTSVPTVQAVAKPHHKKVAAVPTAVPTSVPMVKITPTKGPDVLGQAAGEIAKAGAADGVKKLFGL